MRYFYAIVGGIGLVTLIAMIACVVSDGGLLSGLATLAIGTAGIIEVAILFGAALVIRAFIRMIRR